MNSNTRTILKVIPSVSSLTEKQIIHCTVKECQSTFRNVSNFNMHLEKHHRFKIAKTNDVNTESQYFCPEKECNYNITDNPLAPHFKSQKYLRQHYLKVHAARTLKCIKCIKLFASQALLAAHERMCGQKFECKDCGWSYDSRESLLTHCRRKGHNMPDTTTTRKRGLNGQPQPKNVLFKSSSIPLVIAPKTSNVDPIWEESTALRIRANFNCLLKKQKTKEKISQETQTIITPSTVKVSIAIGASIQQKSIAVGTNNAPFTSCKYKNLDMIDEESNTILSDQCQSYRNLNNLNYIEDDSSLNYFTVGNFNSGLCHIETQTELLPAKDKQAIGTRETDPLLCHMHTQTNDDILSEFGLTDIQTQTYWPNSDYGDLCVSTETQTCLQHLIDNISTETQTPPSLPII